MAAELAPFTVKLVINDTDGDCVLSSFPGGCEAVELVTILGVKMLDLEEKLGDWESVRITVTRSKKRERPDTPCPVSAKQEKLVEE